MDIATLTADPFDPLVGETVTVRTEAGPLMLRLDAVKRLPSQAGTGLRDGFVLTLSGPRDPVMAQGVWELAFPGLGTAALFLSPFAQDAGATRYEIIVN